MMFYFKQDNNLSFADVECDILSFVILIRT